MEDNPDQPNTQDNKYPSSSDPIISSILLIHSANTPKKPANNHKTTLRLHTQQLKILIYRIR
jgi:hypothetical protein